MTSWRDEVSAQAQDDLDGLLDATLPFAQQMLEKNGEFYPYGATVSEDGETTLVAGDPSLGEKPPSQVVIDTMVQAMRRERDTLRAVTLVYDVKTPDSDAIRVDAEHREGIALTVLLPYTKRRVRRRVEYGSLAASQGKQLIWLND